MKLSRITFRTAAYGAFLGAFAFASVSVAGAQEQQSAPFLEPNAVDHADRTDSSGTDGTTSRQPSTPIPAGRLRFSDRVHLYFHSVANPESVVGPAFGAGIGQWRNEPPEWGQGADAFGVRFASGYGRSLISQTIRFGVAAVDREDPRFYPSGETGFWRRARSAALGTFVAHTDTGRRIPAFSRFAGVYGAAFISNEWYPASRADTSHALLRGTTALSASIGWNVFREFWPDIKSHISK